MKKYLYDYIKYVENNKKDIDANSMLVKINFFQHERLIHLIITLFYCLMFLVFLILISLSYVFIIPAALLLIFLLCYIIHYFVLENGIQYLYKLHDEIEEIQDKKSKTKANKSK